MCKYADAGRDLKYVSDGECPTTVDVKPTNVTLTDVKPTDAVAPIDTSLLTATKCQMNCDNTEKYPVCATNGITYGQLNLLYNTFVIAAVVRYNVRCNNYFLI